jgi:large subunit ribosomal protein L21
VYAVIQTGGKQVVVREGDLLQVEKLEAEVGDHVFFDEVLLCKEEGKKAQIGRPYLTDIKVESEVIDQNRDKKILVFDFKRRSGWHKQQGHRQPYSCIKILKIGNLQ